MPELIVQKELPVELEVSPRVPPRSVDLDVSILVPVFNEVQTVEPLAFEIVDVMRQSGRSFEIIFVDDGSWDGTYEAIKRLCGRLDCVHLIKFRRNFGKAAAISAGFTASRGRILVTMDGDLQDDPREIPKFLEKIADYDLVSGWKYRRYDPLTKTLPSRLFNWVTSQVAQVDLHDFNCGFKAYRREVLENISIYGELHRYIPVLASRKGFSITEVKVEHQPRRYGRSKYGWDRLYKGLMDLITVLFITRYTRRPLHFFGIVGGMALAGGLFIDAYLSYRWLRGDYISNRPLLFLGVLLIILGIQVITTGLIGEMLTHKSFRKEDSYSIKEYIE